MRIGIMMRDIGKQLDATGIIVMNLVDKIIELDKKNEYVLFFPNNVFQNRYKSQSNVKCVQVTAPSKIVWDQIVIPIAARREKIDLLFHPKHSIPLLAHCKTVMQLRGAEYWIFPQYFERLDLMYQKVFLPLCSKKATFLIAESYDVEKDFKKYMNIADEKMSVIYLAANPRFEVVKDRQVLKEIKSKYNLPEKYIFTVTRVIQQKKYYPGKNIINQVEAYRRCDARKQFKFVIAGVHVKELIIKHFGMTDNLLQDLIFLDFVPQTELPAIYTQANVFLFPSNYESFGIPILEAQACGCPVITSKTYACPEVSGGAGLLVDPTDVDDISHAIDRVLTDEQLANSMSKRGLKHVEKITWETAARQHLEIFNKVMSE